MFNNHARCRCDQGSARSAPGAFWRLLPALLLGLGLGLSAGAWGQDAQPRLLQVCIADEEVPPYTSMRQPEALGQTALREAAGRQGWQVQFSIRPWRRCLADTGSGHFQAILPISPTAVNRPRLKFPEQAGQVDFALMLGEMRVLVMRQQGSSAEWDGQRFSGLTGPVLYLGGLSVLDAFFANSGQASDSNAKTALSMGRMLLAQRSNVAVDLEDRVLNLLAQDEFRGRLEVLPRPLLNAPVFLAVSPSLYAESPQAVEQLWRDMAKLFRAAIEQHAKSR
ncbi:MAG: hypothetical protein WA173_14740 [Pseudomonas sp.]|uniref:hypothetical protein n=1 Tax=Pseudomonas sp. TaxID=306 RepID=UPI003BB56158